MNAFANVEANLSEAASPVKSAATTADIWLALLSKGGWWRATQIRTILAVDANTIHCRLKSMVDKGSLVKHPDWPAYAVDNRCKVPLGVTLEEILKAARS